MSAKDAGLHSNEAKQAPGGEDHAIDQERFGLTGRLVGLEEAVLDDAEGFGILAGEEHVDGEGAMREAVVADGRFSPRSPGAGGFEGVAPASVNADLGAHGDLVIS